MSIGEKLAHKAEAVNGATTKYFGRATPDCYVVVGSR
ncbi:Mycobacterium numidiamassiliense ORFan [Mycobacterium numidiamassiliense]|jgi:hypothetical protein|uniref:Mycobacterium numidiamassiliense ORFan n=1 Tax=Mycobacterium numidiamassiliense TaxID=1841861 RepID=A0A2U3PDC0_9MYCO|nr:Mycobacterium numidiamassiliense ORFan [Mycobacterium numidiamassiliense]